MRIDPGIFSAFAKEFIWQINYQSSLGFQGYSSICILSYQFDDFIETLCGLPPGPSAGGSVLEAEGAWPHGGGRSGVGP